MLDLKESLTFARVAFGPLGAQRGWVRPLSARRSRRVTWSRDFVVKTKPVCVTHTGWGRPIEKADVLDAAFASGGLSSSAKAASVLFSRLLGPSRQICGLGVGGLFATKDGGFADH